MSIGSAGVVARADLRRRWRDRSLIVQGVLGPLLLAFVVSLVFGGSRSEEFQIGLSDRDGSATSTSMTGGLLAGTAADDDGLDVVEFDGDTDLLGVVERDEGPNAVIVIPAGFERSLTGTRPEEIEVVTSGNPFAAEVAQSVARSLAAEVDRSRLAVAAAIGAGSDDGDVEALATEAAAAPPALTVEQTQPGGQDYSQASYFAPGMAIFFLYFTLGAGAASLIVDRRRGVLDRIRATPVGDGTIVWGKTAAVLATGFTAVVMVWLASIPLMGADWGPPAPVLVIIASVVAAVAGLSMLVTAFARTDSQVTNGVSIIGFGMALVGGTFFSPGNLPPALASLSLITPNGMAQRAFTELSLGTATLAQLWWVVAGLWTWAAVCGGIALVTLRRRMLR